MTRTNPRRPRVHPDDDPEGTPPSPPPGVWKTQHQRDLRNPEELTGTRSLFGTTTPKERKFIATYIETGSSSAAATAVGLSPATGTAWLKRPSILARMELAMQRVGLTDELLAGRIKDALFADRLVQVPNGDGTTELKSLPDHAIRLKAVDMATSISMKARMLDAVEAEGERLPDDVSKLTTSEIMVLMMKKTTVSQG